MRFLLDENLPLSLIKSLQAQGHHVEHVRTNHLRGSPDLRIATYAKQHSAVLITKDLELGSPLLYSHAHYGLLLLRLPASFTAEKITRYVEEFLKIISLEELIGSLTILELGRYRSRKF